MDWTQKVRILMGNRSVSELARDIGLSQPRLSNALNNPDGVINARAGTKLAATLGVTPGWLFDDSKGMDDMAVPQAGDDEIEAWIKEIQGIAMLLGADPARLDELRSMARALMAEFFERQKAKSEQQNNAG